MNHKKNLKHYKNESSTKSLTMNQWLRSHHVYHILHDTTQRFSVSTTNFFKHLWGLSNKENFVFIKSFISHPRRTGSIFPSSIYLAKEMVSHVPKAKPGIVIELGAGTGIVTEALIQTGIRPEDIIVIEFSHELVKNLRRKFPNIHIIEGNAAHLNTLLKNEKRKIKAVISSLPLRSLPKSTTQAILEQIKTILPIKATYIHFTYSFRKNHHHYSLPHFHSIVSKRIWLNLPPARVDVWVKHR